MLQNDSLSLALNPARYPTISADSHESPAPVIVFTSRLKEEGLNALSFPSDHAEPILVCKSTFLIPVLLAIILAADLTLYVL